MQVHEIVARFTKVSTSSTPMQAAREELEHLRGDIDAVDQALRFVAGTGGAPLIEGAAATFECFNRSRYEEGDHVIFVGEVERCSTQTGASPLLYHGGKFYAEHPL